MYNKFNKSILDDWQKKIKPLHEIIIQASEPSGRSQNHHYDFSIGMHYSYFNLSNKNKMNMQIGNHENLLLCAFNPFTDRKRRGSHKINRLHILKNLNDNNIKNQQLDQTEYFKTLSSYKFVISPEGNGLDCHRHYEALIAGCIPIIEYNKYIDKKYKNLPVLYTHDYSEINTDYLLKKYVEFEQKTYNFSKLFLSNHTKRSQFLIKKYGNFWCNKFR